MHQIDIQAKRENFEFPGSDPQSKRTKISTIDNFVNDTTLSAALARMTAYDGLPFSLCITSLDKKISASPGSFSTKINY